jgi:hypothetical protein
MDAKNFSGKYVHRTIKGGIGHNLPQKARKPSPTRSSKSPAIESV